MKEAAARIKINRLLEAAGWRFFADAKGPANIQLEPSVALTKRVLNDLGEGFEKTSNGFVDFLLLNEKGLSCSQRSADGIALEWGRTGFLAMSGQ